LSPGWGGVVYWVWLNNKHGRPQRQDRKGLGAFRPARWEKILLGAPDFLTYGVLMGKE
jgi:hypothetical protein